MVPLPRDRLPRNPDPDLPSGETRAPCGRDLNPEVRVDVLGIRARNAIPTSGAGHLHRRGDLLFPGTSRGSTFGFGARVFWVAGSLRSFEFGTPAAALPRAIAVAFFAASITAEASDDVPEA